MGANAICHATRARHAKGRRLQRAIQLERSNMPIKGVEIGQEFRFAKTVGEADVTLFAGLTGDFSDTHMNEQYMQEKSSIGTRIAHGALLVGYMSTASTISIAHVIHRDDLD